MTTKEQLAESQDWVQVFLYAMEPEDCIPLEINDEDREISLAPFTIEDIDEVIFAFQGEPDGAAWVAIVHLDDGRYGYVSAECDSKGWETLDAKGFSKVANSFQEIVLHCATVWDNFDMDRLTMSTGILEA